MASTTSSIPISELSWGRTENPKKVYKVGDSVKCFIKEINGDKIALSVKYPDQNPLSLIHI